MRLDDEFLVNKNEFYKDKVDKNEFNKDEFDKYDVDKNKIDKDKIDKDKVKSYIIVDFVTSALYFCNVKIIKPSIT